MKAEALKLDQEDERWITRMLMLAGRQRVREPKSIKMTPEEILAYNEKLKQDFIDGEGLFAE